ncbi:hypothetical protein V8G54_018599 [Vigna mungo]|uniref:Lactate/malate dehydrogenase N-terminal domain-containing protein n=1 Tax=Vigna mungo TaxID=3915 RepID=A0AAQ3RU46_VIGMU
MLWPPSSFHHPHFEAQNFRLPFFFVELDPQWVGLCNGMAAGVMLTTPTSSSGEMLNLQHVATFLHRTKIHASTDSYVIAGFDLCIVTAGARQIAGESRLNLLQRNLSLFRNIIPRMFVTPRRVK